MEYSRDDIGNMRRDALRRTREMHRQNTEFSNFHNINTDEAKKENEYGASKNESSALNGGKKRDSGLNGLLSGLFSGGRPDNDKIIIIALILILAKEGADLKLLIALGYILM